MPNWPVRAKAPATLASVASSMASISALSPRLTSLPFLSFWTISLAPTVTVAPLSTWAIVWLSAALTMTTPFTPKFLDLPPEVPRDTDRVVFFAVTSRLSP